MTSKEEGTGNKVMRYTILMPQSFPKDTTFTQVSVYGGKGESQTFQRLHKTGPEVT
jgi:hypothetical protein